MSMDLTLFGINFTVSDEMETYNSYRARYVDVAQQSAQALGSFYTQHVSEVSTIVDMSEKYGKMLMAEALKYAVRDLIAKGIYEVDAEYIVENAIDPPVNFAEAVGRFRGKLNDIEKALARAEAERQAKINSASNTWSGGGYGIEGALKGAATAAVMNAATGAITKAATSGEAKRSLSEHDRKLLEVINSSATVEDLTSSLYDDIFGLLKTVVDILAKNEAETIRNITDDEIRKSLAIYRNLEAGLYEDEQLEKEMWVKMFGYYPYDTKYSTLLLLKHDELTPEVVENAKFYNIPMNKVTADVLGKRYDFKAIADLQDVENAKQQLLLDLKKYNVEESELIADADKRIDDIHAERETYKGVRYASEEQRADAEALDNELGQLVGSVNRIDLNAMLALYLTILNGYEDRDYRSIKEENAAVLRGFMVETINTNPNLPREVLEGVLGRITQDQNEQLNAEIVNALNKRLGKMQRAEKVGNMTNNVKSSIGGFFKKQQQ